MDWSFLIWILVLVFGCYVMMHMMMRGMGHDARGSARRDEPPAPEGRDELEPSRPDRRER